MDVQLHYWRASTQLSTIFGEFVMALNESIQLEQESEKAGNSSKTCYGQLTMQPKDEC